MMNRYFRTAIAGHTAYRAVQDAAHSYVNQYKSYEDANRAIGRAVSFGKDRYHDIRNWLRPKKQMYRRRRYRRRRTYRRRQKRRTYGRRKRRSYFRRRPAVKIPPKLVKVKYMFQFDITYDTTASYKGTYRCAIPVDCTTQASGGYHILTGGSTYTSNSITDRDPYAYLQFSYLHQRVCGIKLKYTPYHQFDTSSADEQIMAHPIWTRYDPSTRNDQPNFVTTGNKGTSNDWYNKLMMWPNHKRHVTNKPWQRFFKIRPVKQQYFDNSAGGSAGRWFPTDSLTPTTSTYGWIHIEQPLQDTDLDAATPGYMEVTKYILLWHPDFSWS